MALQFNIEVAVAVDFGELLEALPRLPLPGLRERRSKRSLIAAGQADQSRGKFREVIKRCRTLGLRCFAHFEARNELTKILIADLRCAEQHNPRWLIGTLMRQP